MKENRAGYNFSPSEREVVRTRADGGCEFPGEECLQENTGIVNHLTGVYEARLDNKTPESISDPNLNALMLCSTHSYSHDVQEQYQVECLKYEKAK